MKMTGDQQLIKKINKFIVLDQIKRHYPLSRADISAQTGLNKATVSTMVSELIEDHLVTETGLGESSGGRKPMMLLFHQQAGYAIGVDLGVNYILAVVTDLSGSVVLERRVELTDLSVSAVMDKLKKCIRALIKKTPPSPHGIIGIGVGVPGIVDDEGIVLSAPNLGWEDIPLRDMLMKEFGLEVVIDNEANTGALGEKQFGAGKAASSLIYISVGIGIGAGIVIGDALYRGFSGFSGEVGHMTLAQDGPLCGCGNRGCWETFASEKALLQLAKERQAPGGGQPELEAARHTHGAELQLPVAPQLAAEASRLMPDDRKPAALRSDAQQLSDLIAQARDGHPEVRALFRHTGHWLGVGMANLINVFNPELIVIGNRLSLAGDWIADAIHETLDARSLAFKRRKTDVVYAGLGLSSSALGASSMAINLFFSAMKATWE